MSQHLPTPGKANVTQAAREMFERMLDERERKGIETYGRSLETWNGRDAHRDLMEELIDAIQYAMQAEMERADLEARIADLQRAKAADTGLPSNLLGPMTPASLRESNAILASALAECGEANAAYVAANEALRQRAEAAEARLAAVTAAAWVVINGDSIDNDAEIERGVRLLIDALDAAQPAASATPDGGGQP